MIFRKFQKNTGLSVKNLFPLIICTVNSIAPAIANDSVTTPAPAETFDRLLTMFNDDIFWAPASGFTENDYWPNIFGDETRSVFGPIPPITCKGESSSSFSAEVDGNQIQLTAVPEGEFPLVWLQAVAEHLIDHDSAAELVAVGYGRDHRVRNVAEGTRCPG